MNAGGHGSDIAAVLARCRVFDLAHRRGRRGRSRAPRPRLPDLGAGRRSRWWCGPSSRCRRGSAPGREDRGRHRARGAGSNQPGGSNAGSVFVNPAGRLGRPAGGGGGAQGAADGDGPGVDQARQLHPGRPGRARPTTCGGWSSTSGPRCGAHRRRPRARGPHGRVPRAPADGAAGRSEDPGTLNLNLNLNWRSRVMTGTRSGSGSPGVGVETAGPSGREADAHGGTGAGEERRRWAPGPTVVGRAAGARRGADRRRRSRGHRCAERGGPADPVVHPRVWQRRVAVLREQGRRRLRWVVGGVAVLVAAVRRPAGAAHPAARPAPRHGARCAAHRHRGGAAGRRARRRPAAHRRGPQGRRRARGAAARGWRTPWWSGDWPDSVTITVTERVPLGSVARPGGGVALVDATGRVLAWQDGAAARARPRRRP